jgi:hypothetical protein
VIAALIKIEFAPAGLSQPCIVSVAAALISIIIGFVATRYFRDMLTLAPIFAVAADGKNTLVVVVESIISSCGNGKVRE